MRWITCFLLLVSSIKASSQSLSQRSINLMQSLMKKEHIPGLAYAVVRDGTVIDMQTLGLASVPYGVKVTQETVFQTASCSKIFCALLLARLFDAKLLHPELTLDRYIDSVPPGWKDISIEQLAGHQSGIRIGDFTGARSSGEALTVARQMPMDYKPGEKSEYVSSDYWILQYIIEKVTGTRYFDALTKYVLKPLGLQHSFVNYVSKGALTDIDIIPGIAQEYHWFDHDSTLRISQMWFTQSGYTAGGIYSSIRDMAAIARVFDSSGFISPSSRKRLSTALPLNSGKNGYYGLGMIVTADYQGHYLVEHSGGPALADFVRFEKEKMTFIVLTNNRGVYPYLAKSLATLYIPGLKMPEVPKDWR